MIIINRLKLHIQYKNNEGISVPGVSTLKSQLGWNREQLMGWVKRVTLEGEDYNEIRRRGGGAGTLVHSLISDYFRAIKTEKTIITDTSEFNDKEISLAENAYLSFLEYVKDKTVKPVLIEEPLISEQYQFGGTPDLYDDDWTLWDWKSGSGIFKEDLVQVVGGYTLLLNENNHPVDKVILLNIPKTEDDKFYPIIIDNERDILACQNILISCREIYGEKKIINRIKEVR